jgi:hypothetical protein
MDVKPVTVAVFRNEYELALAKGMLESAGIECFVLERGFVQIEWLDAESAGHFQLQVWPEEAEVAKEMLRGTPYEVTRDDDEEDQH